jgi:hypothetical protein
MTSRVQTLRSSVSGNRPTAQAPGSLYVNWPDRQIGVADSSGNPLDLVGARYFSAIASYNIGDVVVAQGSLWSCNAPIPPGAFNSAQWTAFVPQPVLDNETTARINADTNEANARIAGDSSTLTSANANANTKLPLAGGTLTGDLKGTTAEFSGLVTAADPVDGDSSAKLATTEWFWRNTPQNTRYRNRIINGDMSVDQRFGGAGTPVAASSNLYVMDRWKVWTGAGGAGTAGHVNTTPAPGFPFTNAFGFSTTTARALVAADVFQLLHYVEGANFNDAMWGTANAQPVVLEFWANTNTAGTFAGSLRSAGNNRSYVFTFTLPAGNVWTKVRLNIPGDITGTWSVAANASSLFLTLNLGAGSNFQATPGSWQAGSFSSVAGAVNIISTVNANLYITGVALMVGAAAANAEPEFRKYSDNLIDCQRYFVAPNIPMSALTGYGSAAGWSYVIYWSGPCTMRATPTVVGAWSALSNAGTPVISAQPDGRSVRGSMVSVAAGNFTGTLTITSLDADF